MPQEAVPGQSPAVDEFVKKTIQQFREKLLDLSSLGARHHQLRFLRHLSPGILDEKAICDLRNQRSTGSE
jgi:hypothetical protein